jgi:hypothetical protein
MMHGFKHYVTGLDFTCAQCGCTELIVEHEYTVVEEFTHTLACDCDEGPLDGIAAQFTNEVRTQMCERGELDEEHRVEDWDDREELDTETECIQREVFCADYHENATENDWEVEENDPRDATVEEDECWVRCAGCDREIEFGWSHPNRGGRIWPAESKDFNPWKCWPEPPFQEAWKQKGWLRPGRGRQERPISPRAVKSRPA